MILYLKICYILRLFNSLLYIAIARCHKQFMCFFYFIPSVVESLEYDMLVMCTYVKNTDDSSVVFIEDKIPLSMNDTYVTLEFVKTISHVNSVLSTLHVCKTPINHQSCFNPKPVTLFMYNVMFFLFYAKVDSFSCIFFLLLFLFMLIPANLPL